MLPVNVLNAVHVILLLLQVITITTSQSGYSIPGSLWKQTQWFDYSPKCQLANGKVWP